MDPRLQVVPPGRRRAGEQPEVRDEPEQVAQAVAGVQRLLALPHLGVALPDERAEHGFDGPPGQVDRAGKALGPQEQRRLLQSL